MDIKMNKNASLVFSSLIVSGNANANKINTVTQIGALLKSRGLTENEGL